ncbi:hypothetical protein DENSPDRAFT_886866 [Dentipellis sp. KUC8613]|nr:hypothetical protein DENSPDRAFT_886866 [Dentipellis sp. KUC8613]
MPAPHVALFAHRLHAVPRPLRVMLHRLDPPLSSPLAVRSPGMPSRAPARRMSPPHAVLLRRLHNPSHPVSALWAVFRPPHRLCTVPHGVALCRAVPHALNTPLRAFWKPQRHPAP